MNNQSLPQPHTRKPHQTVSPDINTLIDSNNLFMNGDIVYILHRGEQYSLRRTRNGKLILNK